MCVNTEQSGSHVPNYTVTGFEEHSDQIASALASLEGVEALSLSACVGASYNPTTNKICFKVPVFGDVCITSPIRIPVGGSLKACVTTCGRFIPTGVKGTVYLNDKAIWSGTIIGFC
ncbi:MAG: hypothetical protein KDD67_09705 [Ignavibacteriae bacterium]|nr:hypothetical protein [Ignavibacteriota bacterium]